MNKESVKRDNSEDMRPVRSVMIFRANHATDWAFRDR